MPEEYITLLIYIIGGAAGFLTTAYFLFRFLYLTENPQSGFAKRKPNIKTVRRRPKEKKEKRKRNEQKMDYAARLDSQTPHGMSWTEFNAIADGMDLEDTVEEQRSMQDKAYEMPRKLAEDTKNANS